jgi:hypothetical protein
LCRYLRARAWDVAKATKLLHASLQWRAAVEIDALRFQDVAPEAETGKMLRLPCLDKKGRPVLLMRPGNENTRVAAGQLRFLEWTMEDMVRAMASGRAGFARGSRADLAPEQMTIMVDFSGYRRVHWPLRHSSGTAQRCHAHSRHACTLHAHAAPMRSLLNAPPIKTSLATLHILQDQYPERLGQAILLSPPTVFQIAWKVIAPFLDARTTAKIHFVDPATEEGRATMASLLDPSQLDASLGGTGSMPWDFQHFTARVTAAEAEAKGAEAAEVAALRAQAAGIAPSES